VQFDLRTNTASKLFLCRSSFIKSVSSTRVHLNAIAIDPRNPNLFVVGGSNAYARMYDIRKCKWDGSSDFGRTSDCYCPPHLVDDKSVGITGLAFSHLSELLVSYNEENIYLFPKNGGLGSDPKKSVKIGADEGCKSTMLASGHDVSQPAPQVYVGHRNCETVKRVTFIGPNDEYVASGSDCGRMFIWRKRDGKFLRAMEGDECIVNCIEPHPHAMTIASSGIDNDVKVWTPSAIERAPVVNVDEVISPGHLCPLIISTFGLQPTYILRIMENCSNLLVRMPCLLIWWRHLYITTFSIISSFQFSIIHFCLIFSFTIY
jgi:WD repeat-containing protein 42A